MKYEKDIILFISQEIYEKMKSCVVKASPNESFGLLIGPKPKEVILEDSNEFQYHYNIDLFECVESDKSSPVDFLMENIEELYRIIKNAFEKYNRRVLSIFHSHPAGAYPSGFDIRYMKYLYKFYNTVLNSSVMVKTAIRNQIWTIMDSSDFKLNGFIYLEKKIQQIRLEIK